jgi:hypothetical protein
MQVLGVTFLLASSIVLAATLSTVGIKAYAADSSSQGNSTDNSHSNSTGNDRSYGGQNNANMTSDNNSTNSNPRSDNGKDNSNMTNPQDDTHRDNHSNNSTNEHHSMADQKREQYVSESAEQRHNEHISSHAPITGPFLANMNYTLTASGNATTISNQTSTDNATLNLNMSTWKSTSSLVAMDITGGSLKVGNNITTINSGHAYYLINHPRLIVFGYVVDKNNNTTDVKLLKIFSFSMNGTALPTSTSDSPLAIHIMGPESKLSSEWFVTMDGQVKLVP